MFALEMEKRTRCPSPYLVQVKEQGGPFQNSGTSPSGTAMHSKANQKKSSRSPVEALDKLQGHWLPTWSPAQLIPHGTGKQEGKF